VMMKKSNSKSMLCNYRKTALISGILGVGAVLAILIGCIPTENAPQATGTSDVIQDGGTSGGDTSGDSTSSSITLSGTLTGSGAGRILPQGEQTPQTFQVIAQSDQTGEIYRGTTDGSGTFEIDIPASDKGNTFVISILGPDGKAVGPVLFGTAGDEGITGIDLDRNVELGDIELPDDPTLNTAVPADNADFADLVDDTVTARLDENGVPVGMSSHGKGAEAQTDQAQTSPTAAGKVAHSC
jgi:hypothetical protein